MSHNQLQVYGTKDHRDVATSYNNLANVYYSQGHYSEAETLYTRALELRKQRLSSSHPCVVQSYKKLVNLYNKQGRFSEAQQLATVAEKTCRAMSCQLCA
jgi:tetratricopeptide (TPR) repeat protein